MNVPYARFLLTVLLMLAIGGLVLQWQWWSATKLVKVNGKLSVGQPQAEFESCLESLGYVPVERSAEMADDETLYTIPGSETFLCVTYRGGTVRTLSGHAQTITYEGKVITFDQTTHQEALRLLGKPTWDEPVPCARGLCYRHFGLYLVLTEGVVRGFSLGKIPGRYR